MSDIKIDARGDIIPTMMRFEKLASRTILGPVPGCDCGSCRRSRAEFDEWRAMAALGGMQLLF